MKVFICEMFSCVVECFEKNGSPTYLYLCSKITKLNPNNMLLFATNS